MNIRCYQTRGGKWVLVKVENEREVVKITQTRGRGLLKQIGTLVFEYIRFEKNKNKSIFHPTLQLMILFLLLLLYKHSSFKIFFLIWFVFIFHSLHINLVILFCTQLHSFYVAI